MATHKKVRLIVGLPGSGKTRLAARLAELHRSFVVDDPKSFNEVEEAIRNHSDIIICDVFLCEAKLRKKAEEKILALIPGGEAIWYFFENNVEQCRKNVSLRDDGRNVEGSILRWSKSYTPPDDVKPIPVWRN